MQCLNGEADSALPFDQHFVQLGVPEAGFGDDLDAMVQFYLDRCEELSTGCFRTSTDQEYCILFCFRDWKNAKDFAERFGGEVIGTPFDESFSAPPGRRS